MILIKRSGEINVIHKVNPERCTATPEQEEEIGKMITVFSNFKNQQKPTKRSTSEQARIDAATDPLKLPGETDPATVNNQCAIVDTYSDGLTLL